MLQNWPVLRPMERRGFKRRDDDVFQRFPRNPFSRYCHPDGETRINDRRRGLLMDTVGWRVGRATRGRGRVIRYLTTFLDLCVPRERCLWDETQWVFYLGERRRVFYFPFEMGWNAAGKTSEKETPLIIFICFGCLSQFLVQSMFDHIAELYKMRHNVKLTF